MSSHYLILPRVSSQAAVTGALSIGERSYTTSEVRGISWEDPMPKGQRPRGVIPRPGQGKRPRVPGCDSAGTAEKSYPSPRSGAVAERSYPTPPRPRPGAAAGRTNPTSKETWLHRHRRAERSYPTLKVRKGSGEEIHLVQGKEQRLCFAGAAVKRHPTPKVRETQVRW